MRKLLEIFIVFLTFLFLSCSLEKGKGYSLVTLNTSEEKFLQHGYNDAIAYYDYTALCTSNREAYGSVREFENLFVDKDGNASLGYLENGEWTFVVRAFNTQSLQLYEGEVRQYISGENTIVPIVLSLRKEGEGEVDITITSRCSGADTFLEAIWNSYDATQYGSTRSFVKSCDGDIDTYTGTIMLSENRYALKLSVYTEAAVLSTDITDILVLAGGNIKITGVLNGQEDQNVSLKPVEPQIPKGHISIAGKERAFSQVLAEWVSDCDVEPEKVYWYMDGVEYSSKDKEVAITLPSPGMHYLTATAIFDKESYSYEYSLNLSSSPLKETGGAIIYDRGEEYGQYWFDDMKEHYRIEDGEGEWRYIVAKVIDYPDGTEGNPYYSYMTTSSTLTGSTGDGIGKASIGTNELIESMGPLNAKYKVNNIWYKPLAASIASQPGWMIPTKSEASLIMNAIKRNEIQSGNFWTSTQYTSTLAYLALPSSETISAVSKEFGAGIILIKYI